MRELEIEIEGRSEIGKFAAQKLRRESFIPVIAYSEGKAATKGKIAYKEFNKIANKASYTQLFKIKSSIGDLNGRLALVKEVQVDYVKSVALHADFVLLREDKKIKLRVPIHVHGEPTGVKEQGGVLSISSHDIGVLCLPREIPQFIDIDVTQLALGDSIHAGDVKLPSGVDLADAAGDSLVSVVAPRAVEEAPKPAEAAEGAAPAEGAAAEGAAPAEGAAAGKEKEEKPAAKEKK